MSAPKWQVLWIGEGFNPAVVKQAKQGSGAYAIREKGSHVVRYVGESSRGVMWKTLLRHFQAPDTFAATRNAGIFTGDPKRYEVALRVTSRGARPRAPAHGSKDSVRLANLKRRGLPYRTDADQRAMSAQARWISTLKPTINKDDGLADLPKLKTCPSCHGSGEDFLGDACDVCRGSGRVQASNPGLRVPPEWTGAAAAEYRAGYEAAGPLRPSVRLEYQPGSTTPLSGSHAAYDAGHRAALRERKGNPADPAVVRAGAMAAVDSARKSMRDNAAAMHGYANPREVVAYARRWWLALDEASRDVDREEWDRVAAELECYEASFSPPPPGARRRPSPSSPREPEFTPAEAARLRAGYARGERRNPVPPAPRDDAEEFVILALSLGETFEVFEVKQPPSGAPGWVVFANGRPFAMGLGTRDEADWLRDSLSAATLDARLYNKVSEAVGPPPTARGVWGADTMPGSLRGVVYRIEDERETVNVCTTDTRLHARFIAQLAALGTSYADDFAKAAADRLARRTVGASHDFAVGDRVVWWYGQDYFTGKIHSLLPGDEVQVSAVVKHRKRSKQGIAEAYPVRIAAKTLRRYEPPKAKPKRAAKPKAVSVASRDSAKPARVFAGGDVESIGAMVKRSKALKIEMRKVGTSDRARGVELAREWSDLEARIADAKKNARGPSKRTAKPKPAPKPAKPRVAPQFRRNEHEVVAELEGLRAGTRVAKTYEETGIVLPGTVSEVLYRSGDRRPLVRIVWDGERLPHPYDLDDAKAWAAAAAAPPAPKPAGYGDVGKRGQLVMFNPSPPRGALTLLGLLTRLQVQGLRKVLVLRWGLKRAPLLAYDEDGRLHVVYRGKVERAATAAERREYERSHWGAPAAGKVVGGGVAVGPFVDLGAVHAITYTTRKGADAAPVDYVHDFGEGSSKPLVRPRLVAHDCKKGHCGPRCAAADALDLHGGSYRVTERGIVG